MRYDTALPVGRLYQQLLKSWTREILDWSGGTPVLLGVPTSDDAGVGYHLPSVENLPNALLGIHAGLSRYRMLPDHYQGVAIYCEWETDETELQYWREHFLGLSSPNGNGEFEVSSSGAEESNPSAHTAKPGEAGLRSIGSRRRAGLDV